MRHVTFKNLEKAFEFGYKWAEQCANRTSSFAYRPRKDVWKLVYGTAPKENFEPGASEWLTEQFNAGVTHFDKSIMEKFGIGQKVFWHEWTIVDAEITPAGVFVRLEGERVEHKRGAGRTYLYTPHRIMAIHDIWR